MFRNLISRLTIFLILFFVALPSFAADYLWTARFSNNTGTGGSPSAACSNAIAKSNESRPPEAHSSLSRVVKAQENKFWCFWADHQGNEMSTSFSADRSGDSCPTPEHEYNSDTGECIPPPGGQSCQREGTPKSGFGFITNASGECVDYTQADVPSQCKNLGGQAGFTNVYVTFEDDGNPINPPPINVGGCEATPIDVSHCKKKPVSCGPSKGLGICIDKNVNKCRIGVNFTGNTSGNAPYVPPPLSSGPGDDGVCDNPNGCPDPVEPPIQNVNKPCVYADMIEDGGGSMVCSSSQWNAKPGQSSCGAVNGKFVCIGKAPTSNGIHIGTKVTNTKNPDGSTTSVKDDTITQTICTGAYSCTTQTSNNKTTIIKDANGNTTGQSSDCTGPHCSVDGKDDKDGDGLKDCIGVGCGSGKGEGEEGEEEEFGGPENEDVGTFGETTSQFMDRVEGSPIVEAARGLSFGSGGSCSFGSFTVPMLGTLSFQPMCAWAAEWFAPLRAIMLAVWALVAVRTFFEA